MRTRIMPAAAILAAILVAVCAGGTRAETSRKPSMSLDEDLIAAVQRKDRPAILSLLKQGANPNVDYSYTWLDIDVPKTGTAPLLVAVLGWHWLTPVSG